MNMALVFLPIPHQPRRKVILSGRGTPPGLQEVVIDAPVGHPPDGRGQLAGMSDSFPRVEDHRGLFLHLDHIQKGYIWVIEYEDYLIMKKKLPYVAEFIEG